MAQPNQARKPVRRLSTKFFKSFTCYAPLQEHYDREYEELKKTAVRIARFAHEQNVDYLIGNDVGGRPAALLVKNVYERLYGKPIKLFFNNFRMNFFDEPAKVNAVSGKRALFVDECSNTGRSIGHARQHLEERGVDVLVAIFSLHNEGRSQGAFNSYKNSRIDFVGSVPNGCFPVKGVFCRDWFQKKEYDWARGALVGPGVVTRFEEKTPGSVDKIIHTESIVQTALKHGESQKTAAMLQKRINDYRLALKQLAEEAIEQYGDEIRHSGASSRKQPRKAGAR